MTRFQYSLAHFQQLVCGNREKAEAIALSFSVSDEDTRLQTPKMIPNYELAERMFEAYNRVARPLPSDVAEVDGLWCGQMGRAYGDYDESPFKQRSKYQVVWECLQENSRATGFEDRCRRAIRDYNGPKAFTGKHSPFASFFHQMIVLARRRGFKIYLEGGFAEDAEYRIEKIPTNWEKNLL